MHVNSWGFKRFFGPFDSFGKISHPIFAQCLAILQIGRAPSISGSADQRLVFKPVYCVQIHPGKSAKQARFGDRIVIKNLTCLNR